MDKIYPGFVSYGGSGPGSSGYSYCTEPTTPSTSDAEPQGIIAAPPQQHEVDLMPPSFTMDMPVEELQQPRQNVKQESLEENQQTLHHMEPTHSAETQTSQEMCAEPQMPCAQRVDAPEIPLPYFSQAVQDIGTAYIAEEKKEKKVKKEIKATAVAEDNRGRNKVADPKTWTSNVRKLKHQRGEAYISRRGKYVPERQVKSNKDCRTSCKLHCSQHLGDVDRQHIFKAFYSLSANEKKHFLLNTTERHCTKRPTKMRNDDEPKRKYCFKYFFLVRAVRYNVCKAFYLGTLAISQKPIYNVHQFKSDMNLPKPDGRGLAPASTHALATERKDRVRAHISSFPVQEPTGTNSSRRRYLDSTLSVKKMHAMYAEECEKEGVTALKESMYRKIFNTDFNLHFRKKRVERCENCRHPIRPMKRKYNRE